LVRTSSTAQEVNSVRQKQPESEPETESQAVSEAEAGAGEGAVAHSRKKTTSKIINLPNWSKQECNAILRS
jgi:hypothetical protein